MNSKYMTPKEVAKELEISAATVVRWVRTGRIAGFRLGGKTIKIPRTEFDRFLRETSTVKPT